jgi:hypothetical protein
MGTKPKQEQSVESVTPIVDEQPAASIVYNGDQEPVLDDKSVQTVRGWLVSVPNKQFNDHTGGLQFKHGNAFVPFSNDEDHLKMVQQFTDEFHYDVQAVEIDVMDIPQLWA